MAGKNALLERYTWDWLSRENTDGCDIWVVYPETMPPHNAHGSIHTLAYPESLINDHQGVIRWTVAQIERLGGRKTDRYIQLQLTQPRRRKGLLQDTLQALAKAKRKQVVVSFVQCEDSAWRKVDFGTLSSVNQRADDVLHCYYDGAIYAWTGNNSDAIFDLPNADKVWVNNGHQYVCDVDYDWQYNCFVGNDITY